MNRKFKKKFFCFINAKKCEIAKKKKLKGVGITASLVMQVFFFPHSLNGH